MTSPAASFILSPRVGSTGKPNTTRKPFLTWGRRSQGFSLIELLIVVAIILIIAAIAIPNLLAAKRSANESAAASSIRSMTTAEVSYNITYPATGYAAALINLGAPIGTDCTTVVTTAALSCLIDQTLSNNGNPAGTGKSGYNFNAVGTVATYFVSAVPMSAAQGRKSYCAVEDNVIRVLDPAAAIADHAACAALPAVNN